jgi:hypothetical protein
VGVFLVLGGLAAPAAGQVTLEWKFNKGDTFFLETVSTFKQTLTTQGKESKQDFEMIAVLGFTVKEKNADNSVVLEQRVEGLSVKAGGAGAADEKVIKQMTGATFTVTLSPKMEVVKFEGYDELIKRLAGEDATVQQTIKAALTEESMKKSVREALAFVPGKPVEKGAQWDATFEESLGPLGSLTRKLQYTYVGPDKLEGKEAEKITFTGSVTYTPPKADAAAPFQVAKGKIEADGLKGTIFFDAAAGRLLASETQLRLKGDLTLTVGGQSFETKMQQDVTNKTRLLNQRPGAK